EPGALRRSLANPNILVPALASMCGIMIYTGISFWLPQYIAFIGGLSFAQAAAYSAVFTITGGIGQIFWGIASDYIGRKPSLILGFVIGVGGGFKQATGYYYGLYFMVAVSLISAIIIALFTRETVGRFKDRDRALVSRERTHVSAGLPQE